MKYLLCYTEVYDNGGNTKVESEDFDNFADAVMRYTLMCAGSDHVVLAETDGGTLIRQFTREHADESGDIPAVFIR